jgi:glycosyltransferase involved in cell wall biosynthesis
MTALVSIVVTAFNKAPYLEQAVKSVLAQTYSNIECLIVDDGSTDQTAAIAEQLTTLDTRVRYFYKPNGGISSARNFGIRQAQGEWLQFLDADDWIHPDKIQIQLSKAQTAEPSEVVIYSDYERVFFDKTDQLLDQRPYRVGALTPAQLIQRLLVCPDFLAGSPFPLLQQAMLFKASIFERIQFDERLKACEDRYLVLALLMQEMTFIYVPISAAYYRKYKANLTDNNALMRRSYLQYFQLVQQNYDMLLPQAQLSIQFLIDQAIAEQDTPSFQALSQLALFPVYLLNGKLKINHIFLLKLFYWLRRSIPSGLLYEKYRGPRSKQLVTTLSQVWQRVKPR